MSNIYSKLLYSPTLANYNAANEATAIPATVIAFIGDDKTIRTQGLIFGGLLGEENNGTISISLGGSTATLALAAHGHVAATTTTSGFMSAADKIKLDGIATGANKYVLPIASSTAIGGVKPGTTDGKIYGVDVADDGSMTVNVPWTNTTYSAFNAATSSANGSTGLVPAPSKGQQDYYLKGDCTWAALPSGSGSIGTSDSTDWKTVVNYVSLSDHTLSGETVSIPAATASQDGYMSSILVATLNTATSDISTIKSSLTTGMSYKGGVSALPDTAKVGDVYRCDAAIDTINAEIGDFIVCKTETTTATSSAWDIWNVNVTGAAYIDSNVVTDGNVVAFDGTTGKLKDSGFIIGKSVPSNAVFTDTKLKVTASTETTNYNIILAANTESAAELIYSAKASINANTGVITAGGLTLSENGSSDTLWTTDGGTLTTSDLLSGYALQSDIKNAKHILKIGSSESNQALSNDFSANASTDVTTYIPLANATSETVSWGAIKGNYGDTTGFTKALVIDGDVYYTDTNSWRNILAKITGTSTATSTYTNALPISTDSGALKFNTDFMVSSGEVGLVWSTVQENGSVTYSY